VPAQPGVPDHVPGVGAAAGQKGALLREREIQSLRGGRSGANRRGQWLPKVVSMSMDSRTERPVPP
jgi:hypothetical protein